MGIVIFGSINMDLIVRLPRQPERGETLIGHSFFTAAGGKGANQAVAAARLGAPTQIIGRLGNDVFGASLRATLQADGIDDCAVISDAQQPSGVALITVDDQAENRIVVIPGANGAIGSDDLARLDHALADARFLLLQLEIPLAMVVAAAKLARGRGVTVILDPAPACPLPPELYPLIDILTPNEGEAAMLVNSTNSQIDPTQAATVLLARGVGSVIIKMADRGVYWADGTTQQFLPAFAVQAVDTVAAGDAFNGALAAALWHNQPFAEAIRWGLAAGALAVTKPGAQPALPYHAEVMALLDAESAPIRS